MASIKEGTYAIYLRKSRADEEKERYGHFETLAKHEQQLSRLAREDGYLVDEVYRELVSGESMAERHEFRRLMELVGRRAYKGIIVYAIDRLGRGDPMEYGWILSTFRYTGTLVIVPGKVYDPNDRADMQTLQLNMFVGQMELDNIKLRLRNGTRASAESGQHMASRAPYGYKKTIVNRKHTLEADGNADTVRTVFALAADGSPLGAIARHLNDSGLRTATGGLWSLSGVRKMIRNPVYKGMIRYGYNTSKIVSRDGMRFVKKKSINDEYIYVKGMHDGIVDDETWEKANVARGDNPRIKSGDALKNPLAGLLMCKKCGKAMLRHRNVSKGAYYVRYIHTSPSECSMRSARTDTVMSVLVESLEATANDIEAKIDGKADETAASERGALERAISSEDRRLDKLMELYCADAISISEFKDRREKSEQSVDAMKKRLSALSLPRKDPEELVTTIRAAISMLNDPSVDAGSKNSALKTFIERIEYDNLATGYNAQAIRLNIILR